MFFCESFGGFSRRIHRHKIAGHCLRKGFDRIRKAPASSRMSGCFLYLAEQQTFVVGATGLPKRTHGELSWSFAFASSQVIRYVSVLLFPIVLPIGTFIFLAVVFVVGSIFPCLALTFFGVALVLFVFGVAEFPAIVICKSPCCVTHDYSLPSHVGPMPDKIDSTVVSFRLHFRQVADHMKHSPNRAASSLAFINIRANRSNCVP